MIRRSFGIVLAVVAASLVMLVSPAVAAAPELAVSQSAVAPDLSVPREWLASALSCTDGDLAAEPVLLVPDTGLTPERSFAWNHARAFTAEGRRFCTVELPAAGLGDAQVSAEYVVAALRAMDRRWGGPVDVLGHGQGAVLSRWALAFWPDTRAVVDDLVGLAPSDRTADAADACDVPCPPAVRQLRSGSAFRTALDRGPATHTGVDRTVVHADAAGTAGSPDVADIAVQDVCPGHDADPLRIGTSDPVAHALALDALDHDGPADPARVGREVCRAPHPGVDPRTAARESAATAAARDAALAAAPHSTAEPELARHARS